MKIEDLSRILEVLEVLDGDKLDKHGLPQCTQEFRELCAEMLSLTQGPTTLYEVVPDQAVIAIGNIVSLDREQVIRIRKIVKNTIHVTIGTLIDGGVLKVNGAEEIMKHLAKLIDNLGIGKKDELEEEFGGDEEELDSELTPKKEVIH